MVKIRTCYDSCCIIANKLATFVHCKLAFLNNLLKNDFWLRKFLQISAVPQVIWSISLICPILDFIPKLVKMSFNSRVILNPYPRNSPFYSVMCIDKPKIRPLISIPLNIPAAKNRSDKFLRPFAFILRLAICKDLVPLFS